MCFKNAISYKLIPTQKSKLAILWDAAKKYLTKESVQSGTPQLSVIDPKQDMIVFDQQRYTEVIIPDPSSVKMGKKLLIINEGVNCVKLICPIELYDSFFPVELECGDHIHLVSNGKNKWYTI